MGSVTRSQHSSSTRIIAPSTIFIAVLAALLLALLATGLAAAAPPSPVQLYFVPFPEDQILSTMQTLYPSNAQCGGGSQRANYPVTSYVSLAASAEGTIIYYDHWEDGYEVDLTNPQQTTTEVWGDGDTSNGVPPGIPSDILGGDAVIILQSQVTNRATIDYDGGDKIGSTRIVAVTRAAWSTGPDTRLAGAMEVYPVSSWGTEYETPVGIDESLNLQITGLFSYTAVAIMAAHDATSVLVDTDADGTTDVSSSIGEGQSLYVPDMMIGGSIQSSAPIQVTMVGGELCENYESRWYTLLPSSYWSDSYYNPVSKMPGATAVLTDTTVFLYNPNLDAITVEVETVSGMQPAVNVPAGATSFLTMLVDSGAHYYTTNGSAFQAIAAIDTGNDSNRNSDWGLTLLPEEFLTRQALVGLGIGRDPTSLEEPNENGSPIWVMPVYTNGITETVQICVDFDGDNVPGLPDGNGFYYDALLTLNEFETARVYDPDGDQTGMILYACDPSTGIAPDVRVSAAWGQAPGVASEAQPGLDLGTAVPPAATVIAAKSADVIDDSNSDGVASPGERLEYTISIQNSSRVAVPQIILSDTVPLHTTYVTSTTTVDDGSGPVALPDGATTPFPLDEGGVLLGDLLINGMYTVTFQTDIDEPYLGRQDPITNTATVIADGDEFEVKSSTEVYDSALELSKTVSDDFVAAPGTVVTYTYVFTNTGLDPLNTVVITDDVCSPVTYVGGDLLEDDVIEVDEVWTYNCSMAIQQPTTNLATVSAFDRLSNTVTATATAFVDMGFVWLVPIFQQTPKVCPPPGGCPLEGRIKGLGVNSVSDDIFVASRADDDGNPDQLLKVDAYTAQIVDRVETGVGSKPWDVVVNELTNRVYVSNEGTAEVVVYDADTLAELARISIPNTPNANVPASPGHMAILPELDLVFVTVRGDSRIAIIEGLALKETIPAGGSGPWGIAADPVRNLVYVSHRDSRSFSLLNQSGDSWVAQQGPLFADERQVFGLDYAPNADPNLPGRLYSLWANKDSNWFMSIWEPTPDAVDWGLVIDMVIPSHGNLNEPGVGGDGIVHNPATGNVYTANTADDTVVVIRGDGSEYLNVFDVSDDPFPAAVNPSISMVYIGLRAPGRLIAVQDTIYPEEAPEICITKRMLPANNAIDFANAGSIVEHRPLMVWAARISKYSVK